MKAITCPVILTSASTKADGSLGLRFGTPELTPVEKTALFELQGIQLKMLLQPDETQPEALQEVKGQFDGNRTPSQRLRAVIFVLWKQKNEAIDFEVFYKHTVEGLIEQIKSQLAER